VLDFFDHQDRARRSTIYLVVLYALAVLVILVIVTFIVALWIGAYGKSFAPRIFLYAAGATLAFVGGVTLMKLIQLRAGGQVIARKLGGRLLDGSTRDVHERRVLHVVEEMAIASGLPVPPVYMLDKETRINAFAAGYTPEQCVIGVTRGCATLLDRAELQGVVAHEFSHVLHADTRLNTRLIGILHGILAIGLAGRFLVEIGASSSGRSSRRDGGGVALIGFGFVLWAVGSIGSLFGGLIKAAVSRQREFLADASAVQYTRDPTGIAGALKKIGGTSMRARLRSPWRAEFSHMYVANGVSKPVFDAMATHPPLDERILRLDRSWDRVFPEVLTEERIQKPRKVPVPPPPIAPLIAATLLAQAGNPTAEHVDYARELLGRIPEDLKEAARDSGRARDVAYALLGSEADPALLEQVRACGDEARLPLVDLAIPALRQQSHEQYAVFKSRVRELIAEDGDIDPFEWVLQRIMLAYLEPHFTRVRVPIVAYYSLAGTRRECARLLSAVAHASGNPAAFEHGKAHLGMDMKLDNDTDIGGVDRALKVLQTVSPPCKRELLHACAAVISADKEVTVHEAELFRGIADALDVPIPPLLPGQKLA